MNKFVFRVSFVFILFLTACTELVKTSLVAKKSSSAISTITGGRANLRYAETIEEYKVQIFEIYKLNLSTNPGLKGRIEFIIHVLENGLVTSCVPKVKDKQMKVTAEKICGIIQEMNFGNGEEFDLSYIMNFFPN
ncbi:hypothetical protein [Aliikangiella sp. G2MR2-5]|uniref:hypothetical protein n=1 Tax=Aliikangiella sp. G2MR2-5 TaxID=2788943 RepID=UPI0018ABC77B|nr:hypothetical protein [Aliikangiella sp. G2MR2-5]